MKTIMLFALLATSAGAFAQDPADTETAPSEEVVAEVVEEQAPVAEGTEATEAPSTEATPDVLPEIQVPETTEEAVAQAQESFSAIKAGQVGLGLLLLLGCLIFVYNRYIAPRK